MPNKFYIINNKIDAPVVRIIDEEGQQLGEFPIAEALDMAAKKDMDLVEIAPNAKPPVCRLISFAKFKYQMQKKEKLQKAHQKMVETKAVRIKLNTSPHDMETKANSVRKFLKKGNKVKIDLRPKGREHTRPDLILEKLNLFLTLLKIDYKLASEAKKDKGTFNVIIENK